MSAMVELGDCWVESTGTGEKLQENATVKSIDVSMDGGLTTKQN